MVYGREPEQRELGRFLAEAASGRGGAVVVLGEPCGGKSALLRWAGSGQRFQVLRCTGVESEAELPFAASQSLLSGVMGHLAGIPAPQAEALRAALGLAPPGG
ncbi:ATP-binding protein [Nonomuraea sp. NPDC050691]|uniref:ATP-binding protein n=1 Tax=Nonomuraea sp. NPDC050691 TaxID=3155661 RepID=UPI0033FC0EE4